jgi:hypothetical protein
MVVVGVSAAALAVRHDSLFVVPLALGGVTVAASLWREWLLTHRRFVVLPAELASSTRIELPILNADPSDFHQVDLAVAGIPGPMAPSIDIAVLDIAAALCRYGGRAGVSGRSGGNVVSLEVHGSVSDRTSEQVIQSLTRLGVNQTKRGPVPSLAEARPPASPTLELLQLRTKQSTPVVEAPREFLVGIRRDFRADITDLDLGLVSVRGEVSAESHIVARFPDEQHVGLFQSKLPRMRDRLEKKGWLLDRYDDDQPIASLSLAVG